MKIPYSESDSDCDEKDLTKFQIFKLKMAYGRHIGKHHFGLNSAADSTIFAKFCMKKKIVISSHFIKI